MDTWVQETLPGQPRKAGAPGTARSARSPARLRPESLGWLAAVSVLFIAAELTPALLKLPLGADEITYIARTSAHASGVFLPPVHGHGAGLLAAPVTLLTSSLVALRVWMAVLSGLGLFGSLVCWRGLRPARVLAIAGFLFGGLAVTQLSGVQVYPDLWAGFGALAITGLVVQVAQGRLRPRMGLPLIAFAAFLIVVMRPQNVAFVLLPTFAAPLVVRAWRKPAVPVAIFVGAAAGVLDWVGEAYLWFGGPAHRIHLASAEPPKLALGFSLSMQVKTLNGPWYCQPRPYGHCTAGFGHPVVYLWWAAFLGLAVLGTAASWRRPAWSSALLAVVTSCWVGGLYLLFVPFGAPRYFLPVWALLAIVAADGIARLIALAHRKKAALAMAGVFLISWAATQHVVLGREAGEQASERRVAVAQAAALARFHIPKPCAVGSPTLAYYLGCTGIWTGGSSYDVLQLQGGFRQWREINLPPNSLYPHAWTRRRSMNKLR
jgi:hypothetical protein